MSDQIVKDLANVSQSELMEQPVTDLPLSSQQQQCLQLLVMGHTVLDTAYSIGVGRATIYRWMKNDHTFAAALNRWKEEIEQDTCSRLMAMAGKATDAVERALMAGDARTGVAVLKGLGLLHPPAARQHTDPDDVKRVMKMDGLRREVELVREEMKVLEDMEKV